MTDKRTEKRNLLELPDGGSVTNTSGGWTRNLVLAASAAVIGSSFQFGYNTGVINAPGSTIQQFINTTYFDRYGVYIDPLKQKLLWGFAVSIFALGGMVGSFSAGYVMKSTGRKRTMLGNNILVMVAIALMGCSKVAKSYEMLIIGRLVIGVNCGINTAVAPLYLTEIAPVSLRGILGISNQLGIVTAILISQILGLKEVLGTSGEWPLLLMLCGTFSLYQLLILPFCPETPAYLFSKGLEAEGSDSLRFLRGREYDIDDEVNSLRSELQRTQSENKISIKEIFSRKSLLTPMIIAIMMQLAQQLSGINAVLYYSTGIFINAGVSAAKSDIITVGMGVANVVMTAISLLFIERLGRRVLMLSGLGGMFLCSVALVISLTAGLGTHWGPILAVVMVMLFVTAFQTGPGSIPWFITAELFNENARASAISVAGLFNWGANFLVGIGYLPLEKVIHGYTFTVFAGLLAIFWIFTYLKVPETKGKSTEEISSAFRDGDGE